MGDRNWIIDLIGPAAFQRLATELSGPDLHSVLLEVMQQRAAGRAPRDVLAQYGRDALCSPGIVDQRTIIEIDHELLAAASGLEAIELSPVTPLATSSTFGLTGQNRVLSALHMTEVVSDPTNVLALECASRLRSHPEEPIHLATSHRVLRTQPVPKLPGHTQHFRMFALASGGRETGDHGFTVSSVLRHIGILMDGFDRLERHGYSFGARRVVILSTESQGATTERILQQLPVPATREVLDHAYYSGGLRYQVWVTAPGGTEFPLVDGGTFDWLATLTSNRRAVFVATGVGSQLIALGFRSSKQPNID